MSYWYEAFIAAALQCLPSGLADFIIQPARLWGVQVVLNLTLVVFHDASATARLAVSGSIAFTTLLWALGKRGEHTVTEQLLHLVTRSREN